MIAALLLAFCGVCRFTRRSVCRSLGICSVPPLKGASRAAPFRRGCLRQEWTSLGKSTAREAFYLPVRRSAVLFKGGKFPGKRKTPKALRLWEMFWWTIQDSNL